MSQTMFHFKKFTLEIPDKFLNNELQLKNDLQNTVLRAIAMKLCAYD